MPWTIARLILADTIEILIVCLGLGYCFEGVPRLNSSKALARYCLFAVLLGPLVSAFFVASTMPGSFAVNWRIWFFFADARFPNFDPGDLRLGQHRPRVWISPIPSIKSRGGRVDRRSGYFRVFRFTNFLENDALRVALYFRPISAVGSVEIRLHGRQHLNDRCLVFVHFGEPFMDMDPSQAQKLSTMSYQCSYSCCSLLFPSWFLRPWQKSASETKRLFPM